jgi:receptor protein-tyrosine kinase
MSSAQNQNNALRSIGAILIDAGMLTAEDAERVIRLQKDEGLRFGDAAVRLGVVSEEDVRFALSKQFNYPYLTPSGDRPVSTELVAAYQPFSREVEQLRVIRSQLLLRWFDKQMKRNVLTAISPGRYEGCSYVTGNLAIVFSQLGERTLLVDADMRAARQHELFKTSNQVGFSSVLAGRTELGNAIVRIPHFSNLFLLPAGPIPPNPLELLNASALERLLQQVREAFDVVLIDTSSMSWGADANFIAVQSGAALLVARSNVTSMSAFSDLAKAMTRSGIVVVGSVLNDPRSLYSYN